MAQVIIAENIYSPNEETYKYIIEMIDINTLLFNIMNINTGINYKLYIKKDSEWYKENMHKIQNDFSQLYQIINDCIFDEESLFRYEIVEEKDIIKFLIRMKKDSKFFKVELDFELERYISDNGIIDDRLNSIEYQLNKLREDKIKNQSHIIDSLKKSIKVLEEKMTKNYDLENKVNHLIEIINTFGPSFMRNIVNSESGHANYSRGQLGRSITVYGTGLVPENPTDYIEQLKNCSKTSPTGGKWVSEDGVMRIIDYNGLPSNPEGLDWSSAAWDVVKDQKGWSI